MSIVTSIPQTARSLALHGVAFAPEIASAAGKYHVDPALLAAVAAQETGGPGSNAGRNVVGDGGHGRGIFQIDDRYHSFATTAAAMDPQSNADYAAGMISGLLKRYGGDVHRALSAYNAGDPNASGTITSWQDGRRLGYADSVLRHYADLQGDTPETLTQALSADSQDEQASVNALSSFASLQVPAPALCPSELPQSYPNRPRDNSPDFGSIVFAQDGSSN